MGRKILHAITRLDRGGGPTNTLLSAKGLAEKGYKVDVLYGYTEQPDKDLMEKAASAGVNFIEENNLVRNISPAKDIAAFFKVLGIIRRGDYDIVHAHAHKAGLIARAAAKSAGVKRLVYTPHGHVFYGYFNRFLTKAIVLIEKTCAPLTDRIIGLTRAECDEWLKLGIGRKEQYLSIPSGIDFKYLEEQADSGRNWRKELDIPDGSKVVGSVGRFIGIKGFEYLVDAAIEQMAKRRDVHFLLAGDGPLLEEYKDKITEAGYWSRFHIISWQENAATVLKALDVFVLPSLNEGMGRVLAEAMCFGKPAIASRVGGVPSVLSDGAGILVEPASPAAISKAIDRLLDDPEEAAEIARKGKEKALAEFSAEKMVNDLDVLYQELLRNA